LEKKSALALSRLVILEKYHFLWKKFRNKSLQNSVPSLEEMPWTSCASRSAAEALAFVRPPPAVF
jgi:hypothetical protein